MINRLFSIAAMCVLSGAGMALSQDVNKLSAVEVAQGFSLLYDGTLNGFKQHWVDYVKDNTTNTNLSAEWSVDAATGAIGIQNRTEDVRSKKIFKDFDLRMEYRCDANEGLFYRTKVNTDRAWQTGIEVAINNYTNENKDAPGAAYDLYPPKPNNYKLHNTGAWNQLRIVAKADSIEHWMNGMKVVGFKLWSDGFWTAYAASKWASAATLTYKTPGNKAAGYITEGYLGLQADHGGKWAIRNFRISESPCPGPVNTTRMSTDCNAVTKVGDASVSREGWLKNASLSRLAGGIRLDLGEEARAGRAVLASLDGRAVSADVREGAREARFDGSFQPGTYVLRYRSAAGESVRKLNLF
jgi:hypothetical protein